MQFKEGTEPGRPSPWYSTAGNSAFDSDQLFDQEVDLLLGIDQEQQQGMQQPTAMDWMLGEYADAAAGFDDTSAFLDNDSSSSSSRSSHRRPASALGTSWLEEESPSNSSRGSATRASASATAAAANDVLPSGDLSPNKMRQLIKQYSWNADKSELLQAVLAAGLYPNFAFVEAPASWQKAADKGKARARVAENLVDRRAGQRLRYTDPKNGAVKPHLRTAMSQLIPQHR